MLANPPIMLCNLFSPSFGFASKILLIPRTLRTILLAVDFLTRIFSGNVLYPRKLHPSFVLYSLRLENSNFNSS